MSGQQSGQHLHRQRAASLEGAPDCASSRGLKRRVVGDDDARRRGGAEARWRDAALGNLIPLSDAVICDHLAGVHTVGV